MCIAMCIAFEISLPHKMQSFPYGIQNYKMPCNRYHEFVWNIVQITHDEKPGDPIWFW